MTTDNIIIQAKKLLVDLQSSASREYSNNRYLLTPPSVNRFSEIFFQLFEIIDNLNDINLISIDDYMQLDDIRRRFENPLSIDLLNKELKAKKEKNEEVREDLYEEIYNQLYFIVHDLRSHLKELTT